MGKKMGNGPVLGMVGCLVLSDEIAYILDRDPQINNVLIVDNEEGRILMDKLSGLLIGQRSWMIDEEDLDTMPFSGYSVIVSIKPAGLHDDVAQLMTALDKEVRKLEPVCDSVLLFYGLCRNTKHEVQRFIDRWEVPLTFLTDEDGTVADDCFGAVLGGRKRYLEMITNNKGTMFITTGYAEHWAMKQSTKGIEKIVMQIENYQMLFKTLGYRKVMMLDNGLGDRDKFKRNVRIFASIFDFGIESTRCEMALFERSYDMAKARIPRFAVIAADGEETVVSRTLP